MQVGESVGNVVLLEHLNLNVADQLSSLWFFTHGLGFTRDPFMPPVHTITWINIGYQQLHLPLRHPSQVFGGVVGVIVPSIGKVLEWLELAQDMLRGADKQGKLRWRWISLAASDHHLPFLTPKELNNKLTPSEQSQKRRTILEVVDPNGNVFHLHENYPALDFRGGLGIAYLEVRCPIGSAKHIARWYRYFLKAIATVSRNPRFGKGRRTAPASDAEEEEEGTEGGRQYHAEEVELGYNGREAKIVVGPKQWLIFREAEEFTFDDGYHICVYISDFEQAYRRAAEQGLLYNEHRYADRARTLEEARHYHQFRIRDIVELHEETPSNGHANGHENGGAANGHENGVGANGHSNGASNGSDALPKEEKSVRRPKRVKSGRLLMRFEHEVRSLQHPLYMRPLVNRFGTVGIFCNQ